MNTDYLGGFQSVFFSPPIRIQCEHSFLLSDSQVETLQSHRRHDGFLHLMYKAGVCMCFWEIWAWNIKPGLTTTGTRMFLVSFVCVLATHQAFWSQTLPLLLIASLVACLDKQLGFSSNDSWTLRGQHWKHSSYKFYTPEVLAGLTALPLKTRWDWKRFFQGPLHHLCLGGEWSDDLCHCSFVNVLSSPTSTILDTQLHLWPPVNLDTIYFDSYMAPLKTISLEQNMCKDSERFLLAALPQMLPRHFCLLASGECWSTSIWVLFWQRLLLFLRLFEIVCFECFYASLCVFPCMRVFAIDLEEASR